MAAISEDRRSKASSPAPFVFSARTNYGLLGMVNDIAAGLRAGRVWRAFAWEETKRRYRRSALGLAWIIIGYVAFVGAVALFFGNFNVKTAEAFAGYVAIGFAAFGFITSNIQDGTLVFSGSASWIKSVSLPYSVYALKSVTRSFLPFVLQMTAYFTFAFMTGTELRPIALLSLLALPVYAVNAFGAQLLFGYLCARYRDLEHMIGTILRILLFVTPILWVYEDTKGVTRLLADLNPVTHYIEIFRQPLLGLAPSASAWLVVGTSTLLLWIAVLLVGSVMRRRLPFLV